MVVTPTRKISLIIIDEIRDKLLQIITTEHRIGFAVWGRCLFKVLTVIRQKIYQIYKFKWFKRCELSRKTTTHSAGILLIVMIGPYDLEAIMVCVMVCRSLERNRFCDKIGLMLALLS